MEDNSPLEERGNGRTFGQVVADRTSAYVGSWTFLFAKTVIIFSWIVFNTSFFFRNHPDPYPYILLNLFLSGLATVENSVIVMSEERAAQRDRELARWDHRLALKAEADNQKILQYIVSTVEKLDGKEN